MSDLMQTLLAFGSGVLAGAVALYFMLPARRQYGRLMRERDEARKTLGEYRQQVDQHFLQTAELVNDMTESYRRVHEHLSGGARQLCSEDGRRLAEKASLNSRPGEGGERGELPPRPPLDYAPSAKGTLSEEFGLDRGRETPFEPVDDLKSGDDSDTAVEPPRDYAAEGSDDDGKLSGPSGR